MDLKFDDEFSKPLSATRTGAGAIYASGKPNGYGVDDFGEAIFAQPDGTAATSSTMPGGYLRIPARALAAGKTDPAGYGRTSTGGLLSSGHAGGSGFVAQYGYFEVRMLAPAGAGTWPAFWLLSSGSLVGGGRTAEIDATELYGNDAHTAFQTVHSWGGGGVLGQSVAPAVPGSGDWALNWHTYGARVTPTGVDLYIDGVRMMHTAPVVHQDQPFFFLVNLALTGNWKAGLAGTGDRADLYVDSIRVWV
jgi:beta-glucanase (GH16 family)